MGSRKPGAVRPLGTSPRGATANTGPRSSASFSVSGRTRSSANHPNALSWSSSSSSDISSSGAKVFAKRHCSASSPPKRCAKWLRKAGQLNSSRSSAGRGAAVAARGAGRWAGFQAGAMGVHCPGRPARAGLPTCGGLGPTARAGAGRCRNCRRAGRRCSQRSAPRCRPAGRGEDAPMAQHQARATVQDHPRRSSMSLPRAGPAREALTTPACSAALMAGPTDAPWPASGTAHRGLPEEGAASNDHDRNQLTSM